MDDNQLDKDNPEYNKIRHFKATWKDYVDFWEKKGVRMTPWNEWDQEYPQKKKMKKEDPIHSWKTFDDESEIDESYDNIKIKQSAGMAIVFGSKVLIGHASGKPMHTAYTIPKGGVDKGESILQAALRETYEEVGIKVPKKLIPSTYKTVSYVKSKKNRYPLDAPVGTHWKDVHYYIVQIDSLDQIGLKDEVISKSNLQLEEIDWAGFVPIKDALKKISPVMKPIIKSLMIYSNNNFKTFESFKSELNEDNPVSLAGSQQDHVPMNKPFVIKSKKKRKGSNEDEDDETQEVANMNTSNIGTK